MWDEFNTKLNKRIKSMNKTLALIAALGLVVSAPVFAADEAKAPEAAKTEAAKDAKKEEAAKAAPAAGTEKTVKKEEKTEEKK